MLSFLKFFAQLSIGKPYATKKLVGSKGNALSRSPQRAEHPCGQGSLRWSLSRRPQTAEYLFLK